MNIPSFPLAHARAARKTHPSLTVDRSVYTCCGVRASGLRKKNWEAIDAQRIRGIVYTGKESAVMVFSERIVPSLVAAVVLLISHAGCVQDQAPGDGYVICTEETIDGVHNPFFANRPMYSANERPLMDSRDYNRLLQESGDAYVPWQSLDRDHNNTNMVVTEVRTIPPL